MREKVEETKRDETEEEKEAMGGEGGAFGAVQ